MTSNPPPALEIVLKLVKPLAPPFHRHIVKSKLPGRLVSVGDRVVVYEVTRTDPEGPVRATPETLLRFE